MSHVTVSGVWREKGKVSHVTVSGGWEIQERCFALLCIALHCFAMLCIALHCFALLCIALHCFVETDMSAMGLVSFKMHCSCKLEPSASQGGRRCHM